MLDREIEGERETLNQRSTSAVRNFNKKVNQYNAMLEQQRARINILNARIEEINKYANFTITSISGGIGLAPQSFKKPIVNKNSPKIRELVRIKSQLEPIGGVSKYGDWIRSNSGDRGARINVLPDIIEAR